MGRFFSQVHFLTIATVAAAVATLNGPSNCDSSGHGSRVSHTTADYVIVGAGPAGVVLAEQLSRDGKKSVVLIEAGPDSINNAVVDSMLIEILLHCKQDCLTVYSSCDVPFYH